jgi:hypothetical protein
MNIQEQIAIRAYELSQQRGGESGHELDDWLQAELNCFVNPTYNRLRLKHL